MTTTIIILAIFAVLLIIILLKTAVVVPNQQAFVVERLGKFRTVLYAGFHLLIPFLDGVAYKRSLKEQRILRRLPFPRKDHTGKE